MTLDLALIGNGAIGLLVDPLGAIVWRNTRLRRAVFLSRCGSTIFARAADEIEMNRGSLDAPDQPMPTYESWNYWAGRNELDRLPVASIRGTTAALAEPIAFAARRVSAPADWVRGLFDDFMPLRALLPRFLEMLRPVDADFCVPLASDRNDEVGEFLDV